MPKPRKEDYLSDKISSIISTAPEIADDDEDITSVQQIKQDAVNFTADGQSDSGDELNLSQFRKINIELLDAEDDKYSGVRVSRKEIKQDKDQAFDGSDDSDNEIDTGSLQDEDIEESDDENEEGDEDDEEAKGGESDDLQDSSEEDIDEEDSEADEEMPSEESEQDDVEGNEHDDEEMEEDGQSDPFRHVSAKVATDIEKGNAIRNQFTIWDSLLECRIKFQKCLTAANKLPHHDKMSNFKQLGGEEFEEAQKACQSYIKKTLNSLMDLQQECLNVNTKQFQESISKRSRDDDEITSSGSSDEEMAKTDAKPGFHKMKKRRKLTDLSQTIKELHESLVPFRNDTIQKWNEKTRITQMSSKDFSAFEQSTLKQIESVLADKQRLLKRTRTKRSNYHILGELDEGPEAKVAKLEENSEIFDDDDFYHQLLRELLERKTTDVADPVQLSRQWIELQKVRSKMKRPVDQKASKGRKLRYNVHQKLVNFMMPIDNTTWTEEAKNELFASLFGKTM